MSIVLPKGYLSYSALSLWLRDPDEYRRRYYEGAEYISTPYTEFGNQVGEALETGVFFDDTLKKVPRHSEMEHKIEVEIEGVPFLMYLDSFDPETFSVLEYKTGIKSLDGKNPWSRIKVRKHIQLTIYQLGVYLKYGSYNPDIQLVWMETVWSKVSKPVQFGSKTFDVEEPWLKLTGHVEVFNRKVAMWELERVAKIVREAAEAISNDYKKWKITKKM